MRNLAYLLCSDWHQAEDLTQTAFAKVYRVWTRVYRHQAMDSYVRQVLVRSFLDERRRPWRREHATEPGAAVFAHVPTRAAPVPDLDLRNALRCVPPRQRAVLVLRFWADLSVDQTAEALKCSAGNVKSQTARGLESLRAILARKESSNARG